MKIIVFAPHNDDEVLGVGGTIAKYARLGHEIYICEATSGPDIKLVNRIKEEALHAHKILGVKETFFLELPVVALKSTPTTVINKKFRDIVQEIKPNIAFIPHKGDIHIDHVEVSQAAMVALRPIENPQLERIYAYETLSETEWNIPSAENVFMPNTYSDITEYIQQKLNAMSCFETQIRDFPNPRSLEAIEALSRFRGSTIGVRNAESFVSIRCRI